MGTKCSPVRCTSGSWDSTVFNSRWSSSTNTRGSYVESIHETALRKDLKTAAVRLGVLQGKWKIIGIQFPVLLTQFSVPKKGDSPEAFFLWSECAGYPANP